jgi:dTDP-4-amino-4,6-dideoxygalactose transaminase
MSLNCQTKDAFSKSKAGGWRYDIVGLGMKINMADVNAAIGLAQIRQYSALLSERKRVFDQYNDAFSKLSWAIIPPSISNEKVTSYHLYALRINEISEIQRDTIIDEISKKGVAVNVHFIPMPMLTYFKEQGHTLSHTKRSIRVVHPSEDINKFLNHPSDASSIQISGMMYNEHHEVLEYVISVASINYSMYKKEVISYT